MKKKLSLLFLALVATIGAWATVTMPTLTTDASNPTYYTIKNYRSEKYACYMGSSSQLGQQSNVNYKALWYFMANGEGVSIVNAANPSVKLASTSSFTETGAVWYLVENPHYAGYFCVSLTSGATVNCWDDQASHTGIGYWQPSASDYEGTSWIIAATEYTYSSVQEQIPAPMTPSIDPEAYLTVGQKVESIEACTTADDNSKWYIVTQNRGGETPMYNADGEVKRAATTVTTASLSGTLAINNAAYLVRFINVGEGLYNIQFADGTWIEYPRSDNPNNNIVLKSTDTRILAGAYAFYNCNNGSGSYFGWNLSVKGGKIIDNNGAGNTLSYWGGGTVSGTSGNNVWTVYETTIVVPTSTIEVTYAQYVNGVATGLTQTETVPPNSEINVPSNFYSGYSSLAYNFSTEGTIGDENVTIKVNIDKKDGVVLALSELSNAKAYTLNTVRGSLGTDGTQMVSTFGTSYSASNFAIISYEDNYYLYSIADSKWVGNPTSISGVANQPILTDDLSNVSALVFNATDVSPLFFIGYGSNGMNVSNYTTGIVVNGWTTLDEGNQYCIIEVADFDATNALAALEDYFKGTTAFANAIARLETYTYGMSLNQYRLIVEENDYTSQAETIISGLKTQGFSAENLTYAQMLLDGTILNMPSAGFYRIKGKTSGKYLASGSASNNKYNMSDATDASTIFYFGDGKLSNFGSGMCNGMTTSSWAWVTGNEASTVEFQDGLTNGGYAIKSTNAHFYDNGDNTSSADRGGNLAINSSTNPRYTSWYLEKVSELPITLNGPVEGSYYATFCVPFNVVTLDGATAYTLSKGETELTMTEVSGPVVAGTPVLLVGTSETATATIGSNYSNAPVSGTALTGNYFAIPFDGATNYVLGTDGTKVGFFHWDGTTLKANRAYIAGEAAGGAKGFYLDDSFATAIQKLTDAADGNAIYYDLSGRRVAEPKQGLYIVNGKKVVVK